jgi:hypothetical protein
MQKRRAKHARSPMTRGGSKPIQRLERAASCAESSAARSQFSSPTACTSSARSWDRAGTGVSLAREYTLSPEVFTGSSLSFSEGRVSNPPVRGSSPFGRASSPCDLLAPSARRRGCPRRATACWVQREPVARYGAAGAGVASAGASAGSARSLGRGAARGVVALASGWLGSAQRTVMFCGL